MKIEKFQLRGNISLCAEAFQLLRGRALAQLGGNIVYGTCVVLMAGLTKTQSSGMRHCIAERVVADVSRKTRCTLKGLVE
jgi:hypothetical protein